MLRARTQCPAAAASAASPRTRSTAIATAGWATRGRVCAKPACIRAHYAEADRRKFEDRQRNRKRTPAEIHELIRGRGRKPKAVGPKQQRLKKTRGAA